MARPNTLLFALPSLLLAVIAIVVILMASGCRPTPPPVSQLATPKATASPTPTRVPLLPGWKSASVFPNSELIWFLYPRPEGLYVGTRNLQHGAELWRVSEHNGTFSAKIFAKGGLVDPRHLDLYGIQEFKGYYYAGTFTPDTNSASILRSPDLGTWETVFTAESGRDPDFISFHVFQDALLAGTYNLDNQGRLYRSTDGITFQEVLNMPRNNPYVWNLLFWDHHEWAIGRGQMAMYYTDDGVNWVPRNPRADDPVNEGGRGGAAVFRGDLYLALSEGSDNCLLRVEHGAWNEQAIPCSQLPGSEHQDGAWSLLAHQSDTAECLLVGTLSDDNEPPKVYRTYDGATFEEIYQYDVVFGRWFVSALQRFGDRIAVAVGHGGQAAAELLISNDNPCSGPASA